MFLNLFLFYQAVRPLGRKSVNKYLYLYLYGPCSRLTFLTPMNLEHGHLSALPVFTARLHGP